MGRIPDEIIAQVIDRSDIVEIIGSYTPLKQAGRSFKALCPFHHEKTPSFIVNADRQIYRCFGCGEGGNVIAFVMKQERLEFPEAIRMLAEKAGITIPETGGDPARDSLRQKIFEANAAAIEYFHTNLMSSRDPGAEVAREYLKARKLSAEAARRFQLGYALDRWDGLLNHLQQNGFDLQIIDSSGLIVRRDDRKGYYDRFRGRVIFPIFDHRGRPVAFGARALKKDERAKYINSPETPAYTKGQHLYGFNWSKEAAGREDAVIVVEGYLDFIRPFLAGVENVAASQGTALTVDQIRLIRRFTHNVIMLYDMDNAGQMATLRSLDVLLEEEMHVRIATLPAADGKEDPDSFIVKYGPEAFREALKNAKTLFDFKLGLLIERHGVETIEGRARICQEIIPTVDKIKNEIIKNEYLTQLSVRLKIPEAVLLKERGNILKKAPAPVHKIEQPKPVANEKFPQNETLLVRMMLRNAAWVKVFKESAGPQMITHAKIRSVVEWIVGQEVLERQAARLLQVFENDPQIVRLVTETIEEGAVPGSEEKIFKDCLARIQKAYFKSQREDLRSRIKVAESSGDSVAVLELQRKFNQLTQGMRYTE